jgi:hypothetical protein
MSTLRERVAALGCDWSKITAAQIYTVHDIRPLLDTVFAEDKVSQLGLAWYPAWPPVIGMEFEVDVRSVRTELVIERALGYFLLRFLSTMLPTSRNFCARFPVSTSVV